MLWGMIRESEMVVLPLYIVNISCTCVCLFVCMYVDNSS